MLFLTEKRFIATLFFMYLLAFCATNAAEADIVNGTMIASLNVTQNCQLSAVPISFGKYDPVISNLSMPLDATGGITLACTRGSTGVNIGMSFGNNGSGSQRYLSPDRSFNYNIYQPINNGATCSYNTVWGNTAGVDAFSVSPPVSKNARNFNVCGRIPPGQDIIAGSYADTILVTVNF